MFLYLLFMNFVCANAAQGEKKTAPVEVKKPKFAIFKLNRYIIFAVVVAIVLIMAIIIINLTKAKVAEPKHKTANVPKAQANKPSSKTAEVPKPKTANVPKAEMLKPEVPKPETVVTIVEKRYVSRDDTLYTLYSNGDREEESSYKDEYGILVKEHKKFNAARQIIFHEKTEKDYSGAIKKTTYYASGEKKSEIISFESSEKQYKKEWNEAGKLILISVRNYDYIRDACYLLLKERRFGFDEKGRLISDCVRKLDNKNNLIEELEWTYNADGTQMLKELLFGKEEKTGFNEFHHINLIFQTNGNYKKIFYYEGKLAKRKDKIAKIIDFENGKESLIRFDPLYFERLSNEERSEIDRLETNGVTISVLSLGFISDAKFLSEKKRFEQAVKPLNHLL